MAQKGNTSHEDLLREIRGGKVAPVYFLMGDEEYFIDLLTGVMEKELLPEEQKAFNQLVFYGKDSTLKMIVEAAMRHPMMSDRQVIIVREAQDLSYKEVDDPHHPLRSYLQHPNPATVLVFAYKHGHPDKRSSFYKLLQASPHCRLYESTRIRDYQMPQWITEHLEKRGIGIDMKAATLLTEYAGDSIAHVMNELEKLLLTLPEGEKNITAAHIEKYSGYSKDFNIFELQNALIAGDVVKAQRIARFFCNDPKHHPLQMTVAFLYGFFLKVMLYHVHRQLPRKELASRLGVREYFLRDYAQAAKRYSFSKLRGIIAALRKTDARSKGIGNLSADTCELLKELLFYIQH